jgi:hypothetical protein
MEVLRVTSSRPLICSARAVQISGCGRRSRIDLSGEPRLRLADGKSSWVATWWSPTGSPWWEQRTKPSFPDGCPMFAPAYMGRKRRGAAPPNAFVMWRNELRPRAKVLAHGVRALEESVFGPCTLGRTWGTRPEPTTVVGRSNPREFRQPNLDKSEIQPSLRDSFLIGPPVTRLERHQIAGCVELHVACRTVCRYCRSPVDCFYAGFRNQEAFEVEGVGNAHHAQLLRAWLS